jgi:uncharacterized Ntn-hydrolase superfamily protein
MTYSIVAYDPEQNQLGVAVQSHSLCVGARVPWAEAGVGAVATQAQSEPSYGTLGLAMMQAGKSAEQALKGLLASDPQAAIRQVAMVDKQGNIAVHTGEKCVEAAGHRQGTYYSVQANLMLKNTVWDAMASSFETTSGSLAERMLKALSAAQSEGGDIRGQQSAALLVVSSQPASGGRLFDLRVDDHPEPLQELQRLLRVAQAFQYRNAAVNFLLDQSLGDEKFDLAAQQFNKAMEIMPEVADNPEVMFWYAVTLASVGHVEESLPFFKKVFITNPIWRDLVPGLVRAELLPDKEEAIARVMEQARIEL